MRCLPLCFLAGLAFLDTSGCGRAGKSAADPSSQIIPAPERLAFTGGVFRLEPGCRILVRDAGNGELLEIGKTLAGLVNAASGWRLEAAAERSPRPGKGDIELSLSDEDESLGDEGYQLVVTPELVRIRALRPAGVFYGVQTLRQLLPAAIEAGSPRNGDPVPGWDVPCVRIEDRPRFPWRGLLLDPARHFLSRDFILKYIDTMAGFKFNMLQLHLTDDQGWRVDVRRYPRLAEVGAWRVDRTGEPWHHRVPPGRDEKATCGGCYSREDIREIVEYARRRYVTIVPEIEMPGHSRAAIAAYPDLLCTRQALPVAPGGRPLEHNALCPGREETFEFICNVLDEVIELFPGPYLHIGGDECDKSDWKACPDCRRRMREEGLASVEDLQGYLIRRVEKHISSRGRKLVGWDEILEGGVPPGAVVMSWHGTSGGLAAARSGHDVVMTPHQEVYFDYAQGQKSLEPQPMGWNTLLSRVYRFEPVPAEMSPEEAGHVLGSQGCLWSEFITSPGQVEYMTYPRALALGEALWSPAPRRDWPDFARRLEAQLERLDRRGIGYARSAFDVWIAQSMGQDRGEDRLLTFSTELPGQEIRYTLDGSDPEAGSPPAGGLVYARAGTTVKAAVFRDGGRFSKVTTLVVQ